jgi:hypothetical protein
VRVPATRQLDGPRFFLLIGFPKPATASITKDGRLPPNIAVAVGIEFLQIAASLQPGEYPFSTDSKPFSFL